MKKLLLFLSFLTVATGFAEAATIHVSITGNDTTGTGALTSPYATIQKAVDVSQDGDVILVAPGTYSGEGNRAINLLGKQITLRSMSGPVATVLDLGRQQGILALSTETLATVVDGFTFRNGYVESGEDWRGDGIISILGDAVLTLKNCIFTANETKATYVTTSTGIVVKRNRSYGATALVQNCLFYGNTIGGGGWTSVGGGSAFVVGATGGEPLPKVIDIRNCTIADNTLYSSATSHQGFSGGIRIAVLGAGVIDSTIVWGNSSTFFPSTEWSSNSNYQSGAQTLLLGSVSYSISQNGVILEPAGSHEVMTWPAAVGSALTADPLFRNASAGDYSLSSDSPAIDAGSPATLDVDGTRSDIGFSLARAVFSSEGNLDSMVFVKGGTLPSSSLLGAKHVGDFFIGRFEVTWKEWTEVRDYAVANGYDLVDVGRGTASPDFAGPDLDNNPVHSLTWYQALKWCNAKSEMEGLSPVYTVSGSVYRSGNAVPDVDLLADGYRLPTESEWEWAALGGVFSEGFAYAGSNNLDEVGWYWGNSSNGTKAVGSKKSNELGLFDMSGNVIEWCQDVLGETRAYRGGGWGNDAPLCTPFARFTLAAPTLSFWDLGLRVVRNASSTPMVTVQGGTLPQSSGLAGTTVSTFLIGRYEVTWREWQEVRSWGMSNGYTDLAVGAGSSPRDPVRLVNQFDMVKWCNARSEKEGLTPVYLVNGQTYKVGMLYYSNIFSVNRLANGYRLPTEAEWEWAARGGVNSQGFTYSGSNDPDLVAWHRGNSSGAPVDLSEGRGSWPVGSKLANELGLHDMSGNVWEFVREGVGVAISRRMRGGGWWHGADLSSLAFRGPITGHNVDLGNVDAGFRVARSVPLIPSDADNDGVNDYRENADGTNPNDANSFNPLSKGLVAYYPLNGSSTDESGLGNHAVNFGAEATTDRFGTSASAFSFDGASDYMDAPPLISDYQRNFTFSGWLKTTHVSSDRLDAAVSALCKTRDAGDFGGPAIDFREGKAVFTFNNNQVFGPLVPFEEWEYATPGLLADGKWRHYIMSIDANGLITAFINGQQVASHQIATFLEVAGASPFQIGRAGGAHEAGRYFPGQIDEVRIYNRGLTAQEASRLYNDTVCGLDSDADGVTDYREIRDGTDPYITASFNPLSVALIANYPFDDSWKDESGHCRDVLAPYTTFEPGLNGSALGLAEGDSQASYWNDPNNINSPGRINTFSFSVWMKAATLVQSDSTSYYLVSAPNNAAYLRIRNGSGGSRVLGMGHEWTGIPGYSYQTPNTDVLRDSVWQHVVGVQEGEATRIYVNGSLVGSTDSGGSMPFDPENFTVGNLFNQNTFQGLLDEVRIYSRALSGAEVRQLYQTEAGNLDSDDDGLYDIHETRTGVFVSATDTGSDPYDSDSSDDGLLDGEVVVAGFNPNTNYTPLFNLVKAKSTGDQARIGLFTENAMMDLNLGGVVLRKSGNTVNLRLQIQSKTDLRAPSWTDEGTETFILDMPGSKAFMRIRALGPQ